MPTTPFFPKGGIIQRVTPGRASPAMEIIELEARALRSLTALPVLLKDTGFSRLDYEEGELVLEKPSLVGKRRAGLPGGARSKNYSSPLHGGRRG